MSDVTQILQQIDAGDPSAAEKPLPLVSDELRKLATALIAAESPDHTLQAMQTQFAASAAGFRRTASITAMRRTRGGCVSGASAGDWRSCAGQRERMGLCCCQSGEWRSGPSVGWGAGGG